MLVGNIRTWESCKDSFLRVFGDTDVFVSTYDLMYGYHPVMHDKGLESRIPEEYLTDYLNQVFSGVNVKSLMVENADQVNRLIESESEKFHPSMRNINSCYSQYRKLKLATEMVKKYEEENKLKYDIMVRARMDLVYENMDLTLQKNDIVFNVGDTYHRNYLPDHFFFTESSNMINLANFMYNEFYNPIFDDSHVSPPHKLFKNSILHSNLNEVPKKFVNHILRQNGKKLSLHVDLEDKTYEAKPIQ